MDKCFVNGCSNHQHQGRFEGRICAPCFEMLSSGRPGPSYAWFAVEISRLRKALERIAVTDTQAIAVDALRPGERVPHE